MRSWARLLVGASFGGIVLVTLALAALGVVSETLLFGVVAVSCASLSLLALVKLPWDLWFAARLLVAEQDESVRRGIAIDPPARLEAKRIASRALFVAVALHVVAATSAFALSATLGDSRGYVLALAYLASLGLRPVQAGWVHVRARIASLRSQAVVPREDALTLFAEARERRAHDERRERQLTEIEERLESDSVRARAGEARLEARLDRVLVELERSAERLTEDRELVAGLRALARVLRAPTDA